MKNSFARQDRYCAETRKHRRVFGSFPDFVMTLICPPLNSPYSASKLLVRIRNSANESRFGIMEVPMFTSSSTSLPLTINALANSRWPLMEIVPGFRSPEGEKTLAPTS